MLTEASASTYAANLVGVSVDHVLSAVISADGAAEWCDVRVVDYFHQRVETITVWVEGDKLYGEW